MRENAASGSPISREFPVGTRRGGGGGAGRSQGGAEPQERELGCTRPVLRGPHAGFVPETRNAGRTGPPQTWEPRAALVCPPPAGRRVPWNHVCLPNTAGRHTKTRIRIYFLPASVSPASWNNIPDLRCLAMFDP